jgi:hypothetical protein
MYIPADNLRVKIQISHHHGVASLPQTTYPKNHLRRTAGAGYGTGLSSALLSTTIA